jgi:DNA polymerase I
MGAEQEWLWGWDETPGIVSVWADAEGQAWVWRRALPRDHLVCEQVRYRPWVLLAGLDDLRHIGARLQPEHALETAPDCITYRELEGPGALRFLVQAQRGRWLREALRRGARRRLGRPIEHLRELGAQQILVLPPEEQYLVASGRNYFRGLSFDRLRRTQFDLETTGLDPGHDRVFLIALRGPDGTSELLEAADGGDAAEADLLRRFVARIAALDPDVIENHNLHGFDLPFLSRRSQRLGVALELGRLPGLALQLRAAARGARLAGQNPDSALRRQRFSVPGRELIDTMDAVRRHDFAARDLPGHGLKAVAKHFGLASPNRQYLPGALVYQTYLRDPARVRHYAGDDVEEAAGLAHLLGGAAFALAQMVPRRYERLADAGPATGVLDPLLVRAYLRSGAALPSHETSDGTQHSGAALYLFATGVAQRIVKADVASLYPSLMRQYRIGPRRDRLGVLLRLVDHLVEQRLAAKAAARAAPVGSAERHTHEALSAAMKLVVNSAYGYMGAVGLTRFSDVHAANEVTRHGREVLDLICRELAARGVTLLEADTDGVYFAVPEAFADADERRVVSEVAALLPARVQLEFDGRYAAMFSHEPKNYALLRYDGALQLRGVAFRSSRIEPFAAEFLGRALGCLLHSDLPGIKAAYVEAALSLRRRGYPTEQLAARLRLSKTPEEYAAVRASRRELPYEALLASGRTHWQSGERVHVYRASGGRAALLGERESELAEADGGEQTAARDYDVGYYLRLLRETYASRLSRALSPGAFATMFDDPAQQTLFDSPLHGQRPILTILPRERVNE